MYAERYTESKEWKRKMFWSGIFWHMGRVWKSINRVFILFVWSILPRLVDSRMGTMHNALSDVEYSDLTIIWLGKRHKIKCEGSPGVAARDDI